VILRLVRLATLEFGVFDFVHSEFCTHHRYDEIIYFARKLIYLYSALIKLCNFIGIVLSFCTSNFFTSLIVKHWFWEPSMENSPWGELLRWRTSIKYWQYGFWVFQDKRFGPVWWTIEGNGRWQIQKFLFVNLLLEGDIGLSRRGIWPVVCGERLKRTTESRSDRNL